MASHMEADVGSERARVVAASAPPARPLGYLVVSRLFPSCLNQGSWAGGPRWAGGLGIRGMYDGVRGKKAGARFVYI